MRRFLLDTGIAQDFINRRHGVVERSDAERRAGNRIGICSPVLGELWAGSREASRASAISSDCGGPCRGWSSGRTPTTRSRSSVG
jgi:hypothetical protein